MINRFNKKIFYLFMVLVLSILVNFIIIYSLKHNSFFTTLWLKIEKKKIEHSSLDEEMKEMIIDRLEISMDQEKMDALLKGREVDFYLKLLHSYCVNSYRDDFGAYPKSLDELPDDYKLGTDWAYNGYQFEISYSNKSDFLLIAYPLDYLKSTGKYSSYCITKEKVVREDKKGKVIQSCGECKALPESDYSQ